MSRQRRTQIQVQKDELRFSISNDSSYKNSLWKQSTLKLLKIYMISFPFISGSFLQLVHNQWWKMVSLDEFYHFSCNKDFQSFTAKLIQRKCAFWIRWLSEQNNIKLIFWEDNRNFHNFLWNILQSVYLSVFHNHCLCICLFETGGSTGGHFTSP